MKQETEDKIVAYIATHPNQSSTEIAAGLGISTGTVKPQLKALAIARKITRTLVGNASGVGRQEFRYFPKETPRGAPPAQAEPPATPEQTAEGLKAKPMQPTPAHAAPYRVGHQSDLDDVISDFATKIAQSVVAQALPQIIPKLREEMARVVAEAAEQVSSCVVERPGPAVTPKPEPKKLPSVFVGGLQPSVTSMLAEEFQGVADLRFATPEDHANVWKSKSAHADHVIIATGFVGHKHVEAVQSTGVKPILVHGGLTHLRDKIMELCV